MHFLRALSAILFIKTKIHIYNGTVWPLNTFPTFRTEYFSVELCPIYETDGL